MGRVYPNLCGLALLVKAFRTIDEVGAGYIETARMNELLMTRGTPFRAKEIEAFMSVAKVVKTRGWISTSQTAPLVIRVFESVLREIGTPFALPLSPPPPPQLYSSPQILTDCRMQTA